FHDQPDATHVADARSSDRLVQVRSHKTADPFSRTDSDTRVAPAAAGFRNRSPRLAAGGGSLFPSLRSSPNAAHRWERQPKLDWQNSKSFQTSKSARCRASNDSR